MNQYSNDSIKPYLKKKQREVDLMCGLYLSISALERECVITTVVKLAQCSSVSDLVLSPFMYYSGHCSSSMR